MEVKWFWSGSSCSKWFLIRIKVRKWDMQFHLPGSGLQAMEGVKTWFSFSRAADGLVVVAVTSHGRNEDAARCRCAQGVLGRWQSNFT